MQLWHSQWRHYNLITAFLIGLFTEQLLVVCVFTLSFMTLRSFTGGFHCDDSLFCYIGSSLVLFIPVYMGGQFASLSVLTVVLTLAAAASESIHQKDRVCQPYPAVQIH